MEKNQELKVFLDTNIPLSGIFFKGNESKILSLPTIKLITCDVCITELYDVVSRKLPFLDVESLRIALLEISRAIKDIEIIKKDTCEKYLPQANKLISHKKDQSILSCILKYKPDYFVTGDSHFYKKDIQSIIKVRHTSQILN